MLITVRVTELSAEIGQLLMTTLVHLIPLQGNLTTYPSQPSQEQGRVLGLSMDDAHRETHCRQ